MIILINSSKTMRPAPIDGDKTLSTPQLLPSAKKLAAFLKTMDETELAADMHLSVKLAAVVKQLVKNWSTTPGRLDAAVDSYVGDTYSGLQAHDWNEADRRYAQEHLRIISGLYGIVRPLDSISAYRLEMGYTLPNPMFRNLYTFWGNTIATTLPTDQMIVNLTAKEYGKTVTDYIDTNRIITPQFLTVSPKTGQPTFVVVHAKIARGAFADWMIRQRIHAKRQLPSFDRLGYRYDHTLSTARQPVYVCETFQGLGLSIRQQKHTTK